MTTAEKAQYAESKVVSAPLELFILVELFYWFICVFYCFLQQLTLRLHSMCDASNTPKLWASSSKIHPTFSRDPSTIKAPRTLTCPVYNYETSRLSWNSKSSKSTHAQSHFLSHGHRLFQIDGCNICWFGLDPFLLNAACSQMFAYCRFRERLNNSVLKIHLLWSIYVCVKVCLRMLI